MIFQHTVYRAMFFNLGNFMIHGLQHPEFPMLALEFWELKSTYVKDVKVEEHWNRRIETCSGMVH